MKHVVIMDPYDAERYQEMEESLRDSIASIDYNPETGKYIVKVQKSKIEQLLKDFEFFNDLPTEEVEKIVWA